MTTAKAAAILCFSISASACGHYADFTLPRFEQTNPIWLRFAERSRPVLTRDSASDVLNPSVVFTGNEYLNFYSEFDGRAWHTALARSPNGFVWKKEGRILSPAPGDYIAANGSALISDGEYFYWSQTGHREKPHIDLARSRDAHSWTKQPALPLGPYASWDELAVADPYVLKIGDWFYLYFLGQNRSRQQQIGVARSKNGFVWQKLRSNPVLASSDENLGEPAVFQFQGWYWMLFTVRDAKENRSLGLARSLDGVGWERSDRLFRGAESWDSKVLCDPTVLVQDGKIKVWFGGGDVASPDENLHGQIGYGELIP